MDKTAQQRFGTLNGKRQGMLRRFERYAGWTLPKICLPDCYDQNYEELAQDYQSVGAQAVNHLSNKLMLALFAPSRPCMRLDVRKKSRVALEQAAQASGNPAAMLADVQQKVAKVEKEATDLIDKRALRPKLYEVIKHLVITGNVLLVLEKDDVCVIGIKKYVVRRNGKGKVLELVIKEELLFDELEQDAQDYYISKNGGTRPHSKVCLYKVLRLRQDKDYELTQWVNETQLDPDKFDGKFSEENCPYRVLTWDLAQGQHYGTGLVEDYANDFAGLSKLSESQVQNAILSSEFRWLANPAGMTSIAEFAESENGAVLPGNKDDLALVESSKRGDLQTIMAMTAEYVNRVGRGFLLASMLVRQAERVTAEEIRQTAQELETALGGAYSRIAVDFQGPLARWLLLAVNTAVLKDFEITIITGMDALSRAGDLDDLKLWLSDLAGVEQLPEGIQGILDMKVVMRALALPRRIDADMYMKSDAQIQQEQQARQEAMAQQALAQAGAQQAASAPMQGQ